MIDNEVSEERLIALGEVLDRVSEIFDRFAESMIQALEPIIDFMINFHENLCRAQLRDRLENKGFPPGLAGFISRHWPSRFLPDLDLDEEEENDGRL